MNFSNLLLIRDKMFNSPTISNKTVKAKNQRKKKSLASASPNDSSVTVQLGASQSQSAPVKEVNKTTLERSIASISHLHASANMPPFGDTEPTKTGTNSAKRRSKKSAKNQISNIEDSEDPWIPVLSKKPTRDRIPSVSEIPEPLPSSYDVTEISQKKKRKRKTGKGSDEKSFLEPVSGSDSTSLLNQKQLQPVESTFVSSPSVQPQSATNKQPRQNPKKDFAEAELQHSQVNTNASPYQPQSAVAYTQELECIISETLGSDVIVNTRSHHSGLSFATPLPISSSKRPLQNPPASEFIQLQAHLRAKEAECQVLHDEVVRMHANIIQLKAAALSTVSAPTTSADSSASVVKRAKVKCVSKETQCDVLPPETSAPRSSDIVIGTLQEEIGRLAKENTILSQRNTNLENRIEVAKQRLVTTQANLQRSSAEAVKAANLAAKETIQQTTSALNQVQTELRDCQSQIDERDYKIQQLEDSNQNLSQELKNVQQEYKGLLASTTSLKNDLLASNIQSAELRHKLAEITLEKDSAVQKEKSISASLAEMHENCANLETSFQAESQSCKALKQRLSELEIEVETSRRLGVELKENLTSSQRDFEKAKRDLDVASSNLTKANQEISSLKSHLDSLQHELEESSHELVLANQKISDFRSANAVDISNSSYLEPSSSTTDNSCESCRDLSADLEHYRKILCSTDSALTQLQKSVSEEEVKWRQSLEDYALQNLNLKKKLELMAFEVAKSAKNEILPLETEKQIISEMPLNGYSTNDVLKKTSGVDRRSSEYLLDDDDDSS